MFIKGLRWDDSSCLMGGGGRFLFTSHCCPWWMSFELDKQEEQLQVLSKSHQHFLVFLQRFSSAMPLSGRFFSYGKVSQTEWHKYLFTLVYRLTNLPKPSVTYETQCSSWLSCKGHVSAQVYSIVLNYVQRNVVLFFATAPMVEVLLF